jgi:hypothetical protein
MAYHRTAAEVLQEHKSRMGATFGAEFHGLYNEVLWLHLKWRDYRALFGTNPARIDLLNAAAGSFFVMADETMWHDLMLHVCRLTDQSSNKGRGRKERLSIMRLTAQVDPAIHDEVRGRVSKALKKTRFARDWRDRHIAHRDLRLAMKTGAKPLAPASRTRMGEAIDAIVAVVAAVESHYCGVTTAYELTSRLGDAEALLHVLRDGVDSRHQKMQRLAGGKFKPKPPI